MNCKPGDLAVIVRAMVPVNIGKLCEVLEVAPDWDGLPAWKVRVFSPSPSVWRSTGRPRRMTLEADVPDANLRPIRDPGDDAVDETLLRLGSPTKEAA